MPTRTACVVGFRQVIEQKIRSAAQLPGFAPIKIHKQQPRYRIDCQIAQRVEHTVAPVVGNKQRLAVFDVHKARIAAPVRGVDMDVIVAAAYEKCIGPLNPFDQFICQCRTWTCYLLMDKKRSNICLKKYQV